MKFGAFFVAIGFMGAQDAMAQGVYLHPIQVVGGFGSLGTLRWTNHIPTTAPTYAVLRASSVTGHWSSFLFVTNAHTVTLTNSLTGPGQSFHKLAWIADTQTVFNYVFEEVPGNPSVIGQLNLTLVPGTNMGVWFLAETPFAINHYHPVGSAAFWAGGGGVTLTTLTNHSIRLHFTPPFGDMGVHLEGALELGMTNGRPIYRRFSGTVFENRFGGPEEIGTFTATRSQ